MKTGLTLGKFAPFHRGHQHLIEIALAEVDHLIVMVYDAPETTSIPLPVRAGWIQGLYPAVEILEAWDGPSEVGDDPETRRRHEDYIVGRLDGRSVTHFFSSEFYGEHVSRALGALDRRVDPERVRVPVSGTEVRRDPYANRAYLDPLVYRDLIARVVFLGAPSTGKSTLARELARIYSTRWMPEYGRDYWHARQRDRRLSPDQLVELAEGHRRAEEALLLDARGVLFVDTDATTTFIWSMEYHGDARPRLAELARDALRRYDLFFLCEDDFPYEDTWDRSGEGSRSRIQKRTRADLVRRGVPFVSLRGSLERRIATVGRVLDGFDRYRSVGDRL